MKNNFILLIALLYSVTVAGQQRVGIGTSNPLGTLDIHRGTANDGTLIARGTTFHSHFNYSVNEHTIIRGGKNGSNIYLNDIAGLGNVIIGEGTPAQKLSVFGSTYISDKLGIGHSAPNAAIQLSNVLANRRIVLWEAMNNDHQFYGFGVNGSILRYQVAGPTDNHIFYAGATAGTSNELMRIVGNGNVSIGNLSNPLNKLDIQGGAVRSGTHSTGRPLYVTGNINSNNSGVEIMHDNGTQGVGIGYNTIYAAGSNTDQDIGMLAKGAVGKVSMTTNGIERMRITGAGNVGIGVTIPGASLEIARGTAANGTLMIRGTTYHSYFNLGTEEHTVIRGGKPGAHIYLNEMIDLGNVGIGPNLPQNKLDIEAGSGRSGTHGSGRPLYVTGNINANNNGVEFRQSNGAQGVGIGYNTMYAAGSNADQDIGLAAKGPGGNVILSANGTEKVRVTSGGSLKFPNAFNNRNIVLWDNGNNNHQFYGFGNDFGILRYQVSSTGESHVFYAATSPTTSNELMRIEGNGNLDVVGEVEMGYSIEFENHVLNGVSYATYTCNCQNGQKVLGGGGYSDSYLGKLVSSYAYGNNAWTVTYHNTGGPPINITIQAICARIGN